MIEELVAKREYEIALTRYVSKIREYSNKDKIREFAELRKMPISAIEDAGIFYIDNMAEMLIPEFLGKLEEFGVISSTNNKPIFEDRWVIPILNKDGLVQNLVGYKPKVEERYIYGTAKYYRRSDTLWGLENLDYAYEIGWAIVTEGITDALRYRSLGYKNAFARCGTRPSDIINNQLNRCRYGVIRVPDRDSAGEKTKKHWVTNRYVTLNTPLHYKDSDETCYISEDATEEERLENQAWLKQYIDDCAKWLLQQEHRGYKCPTIEATML